MRRRPARVRGPVLSPPCIRQRRRGSPSAGQTTGAAQGAPFRVRAPQRGRRVFGRRAGSVSSAMPAAYPDPDPIGPEYCTTGNRGPYCPGSGCRSTSARSARLEARIRSAFRSAGNRWSACAVVRSCSRRGVQVVRVERYRSHSRASCSACLMDSKTIARPGGVHLFERCTPVAVSLSVRN